ncbi:MAG: hypothetical protein VW879_16470, partial [Opitutae bacterium]
INSDHEIEVYYPRVLRVEEIPNNVVDTSNAQVRWSSHIISPYTELSMSPPINTNWTPLVENIRFYTHEASSPVEVRRMALGSNANIRWRNGQSANKKFHFEVEGKEAALGFALSVDAMCIRLRFPDELWSSLGSEQDPRYRAVRTARFHYEATRGKSLDAIENFFAREWLAQLLITAISNEAVASNISLKEATVRIKEGTADLDLHQTLDLIFQSPIVDDENADDSQEDKLREELSEFIDNPNILETLFELAKILWTSIDEAWEPWLRERFAATAGAAALSAIADLCPEINEADLVLDLMIDSVENDCSWASFGGGELWISEAVPGGYGQIEEVMRRYQDDPRRFFSLMTSALRDNDFTLTDYQLARFLTAVVEGDKDDLVPTAVRMFRQAVGAEEAYTSFSELRRALATEGFLTFHAFLVALSNRILRPGSNSDLDAFFLSAIRLWDQEEERLGVELDARVLAYQMSTADNLDGILRTSGIDTPTVHSDHWRFGVIYGLLWPRGSHIRQSGLQCYSPFVELPKPEPLLLHGYLKDDVEVIDLMAEGWEEKSLSALAIGGSVTLSCEMSEVVRISSALVFLITNPVQLDYISVYARIRATRRVGNAFHVELDIAEAK